MPVPMRFAAIEAIDVGGRQENDGARMHVKVCLSLSWMHNKIGL